ncbi:MAG: tRNA pseudouridine(13) synthase TruD [Steroidobacteraceae bacterium]
MKPRGRTEREFALSAARALLFNAVLALRCAVRELSVEADAQTLTLSFSLGRGQYATAVLREICDFDAEPPFESDAG